ncbi:MAG TPA: serine protease [Gallionella sp.]
MRGTGFAVSDGHLIATNAHVVPDILDAATNETLVALLPGSGELQPRELQLVAKDVTHDLALLRLAGAPLSPVTLRNPESVLEGQSVAFTGFPIGGSLGFSPVTHRGTISAISPISLPGATAQRLNEKMIRQLRHGTFMIFQLDATAYPGNSGSPMFDPDTGEVLGLINMVFIKTTREASLSQPSGISYAIPANFLLDLLGTQQKLGH